MATPSWQPLMVRGELSPRLVEKAKDASGVYAVREADSHRVVYVGESSRGVLWKTLLRHFQAPDSFKAVRERGIFMGDPAKYEVAIEVTSRGPRPRPPAEGSEKSARLRELERRGVAFRTDADQRATELQAEWIKNLRAAGHELVNVDDGQAYVPDEVCPECEGTGETSDLMGDRCPVCKGSGRVQVENPALQVEKPAGALIELGALTGIEQGRRAWAWSLREAPILAYDKPGRLFIVYAGKVVRASTPAELKEYGRTHWGARGRGVGRGGAFANGPFRSLGAGKAITYTTRKGGDRELVDYVHAWGEGARGLFTAPLVVEHACADGKCKWNGALALIGGSYRVTDRGIVG